MKAIRFCITLLLGVVGLEPFGCSARTPDLTPSARERTGSVAAAITDGDSADVTTANTLPERAVGALSIPFPGTNTTNTCSGTLVLRNVVLTAAHCFVNNGKFIPSPLVGTAKFILPLANGTPATIPMLTYQATITDLSNVNVNGNTGLSESDADQDLAVVFLQRNVTQAEVPDPLPRVYTGGDFIDRVFNGAENGTIPPPPPPVTNFFGPPTRIVGFAMTINTTNRRKAGTVHSINFTADCGLFGQGTCTGPWISFDQNGTNAAAESGDSGGPITFLQNGTDVTIFGVDHGFGQTTFLGAPVGSKRLTYSPTYNTSKGQRRLAPAVAGRRRQRHGARHHGQLPALALSG